MEVFLFKKILSYFLFPLQFCLLILFLGLLFLWFGKRQKLGKILVTAGACLLVIFSHQVIATSLLERIEGAHPPFAEARGDVAWIVVLSSGVDESSRRPFFNRFPASTLYRLLEGVRVYHLQGGGKVLFTGPSAALARQYALSSGIPSEVLFTAPDVLDTDDEAREASRLMKGQPCILVTSASHMTRAMELFSRRGIHPIAAPAEFKAVGSTPRPVPDVAGLEKTTVFFYEAMGQVWVNISKWIRPVMPE